MPNNPSIKEINLKEDSVDIVFAVPSVGVTQYGQRINKTEEVTVTVSKDQLKSLLSFAKEK